jgi:predicted HicB family RNase H-like nuclease
MKRYAMIQIDAEVHQMLKEYCKERGYKLNGLVEALIKEKIQLLKPQPKNVLPSIKS